MSRSGDTPVDLAAVADEHARLIQSLSGSDSVPSELRDTTDLLESLERDISVREGRLKELAKTRVAEHKDLDVLQRSHTKRFMARLRHGGKEGLSRILEKEEREYVEAAQAEHNENVAVADLKEAADEAKKKKESLEQRLIERSSVAQRLASLYKSAFTGPTPDYPEEDAAEEELREAEKLYEDTQSTQNRHQQNFKVLEKAAAFANQAQTALQNANRNATYDTFGVAGIWAEMAERDDLMRAQTLSSQARDCVRRARASDPSIKDIAMPKLVSPDWLNIVFDNLYTDIMFQQKIQESMQSMTRFQNAIFAECRSAENRTKETERKVKETYQFLQSKRRGLVAVRREILTRVAEEDIPPMYRQNPSTQDATVQLINAIVAPSNESLPPGYDSPSGPAPASQYAPPSGPPPGTTSRRIEPPHPGPSQSASPQIYGPPAGPPPGHPASMLRSASPNILHRQLSSGSSTRSRSISPRIRPSSAPLSPLSSPRAQDVPLPSTPNVPNSPGRRRLPSLQEGPSEAFHLVTPNSPALGPTRPSPDASQLLQFPEPQFSSGGRRRSPSPAARPNLASPWRTEAEVFPDIRMSADQPGHASSISASHDEPRSQPTPPSPGPFTDSAAVEGPFPSGSTDLESEEPRRPSYAINNPFRKQGPS